jgi:large conductance mechanosensitive channel
VYSIAAAFTTVVTSFVSDILLPPLSLLPFINKQLDEKFAVLRSGPNYNETQTWGYNTLQQAIDDGAVVLAYGNFIDKLINFFGIGLSLYLLSLLYQALSHDTIIHETTRCKFCKKFISVKVWLCYLWIELTIRQHVV